MKEAIYRAFEVVDVMCIRFRRRCASWGSMRGGVGAGANREDNYERNQANRSLVEAE